MMTAQEYMDFARFPLTTQPGLDLDRQMMVDMVNLDELNEAVQNNATLTVEEQQIAQELNQKRAFLDAMKKQRGLK